MSYHSPIILSSHHLPPSLHHHRLIPLSITSPIIIVSSSPGSFGVAEDDFFFKASEYARERGIPRVFIACNSGARIGLVDELKPKFKVGGWV